MIFLFVFLIKSSLNSSSNTKFNETSITLLTSLRGGGQKSDSISVSSGFVSPPPSQRSSKEQVSPDPSKMPPKFGYTPPGAKKLPDNPGGNSNNQGNDDWKKAQKNPEMWSDYQEYCIEKSKKNKQCDLIEIESKIKEDTRLVILAEEAGKSEKIQRDLNKLIDQLRLGNESPGIGTKTVFKGVKEARSRSGGRVYYRKKNGKIEILGKSNKKNQHATIKILKKKYE